MPHLPFRPAIALAFGLAATVMLTTSSEASAGREWFRFGIDRTAWYWSEQIDQAVEAGPAAQRVRLANPQRPDTLPVAAAGGEPDKVSAIAFDLAARGLESGSTITRLEVRIEEGSDREEVPPVNARGKGIRACRITSFWAPGDAEKWEARPDVADDCVEGTRDGDADPPAWTFDLLPLSGAWAQDPFQNHGVMLTPLVPEAATPEDATWQINLKVPQRDREGTERDDYRATRDRLTLRLAFDPPPAVSDASDAAFSAPPPPPPPASLPPPEGPSFADAPSPPQGAEAAPALAATTTEGLPAHVYAIVPLALLAFAATRSVVMGPPVPAHGGGVLETIRARNEGGAP